MVSKTIPLTVVRDASPPIGSVLHDWVVTVDHKKLGILYILYAVFFLVIGGIEATIMRIQLIVPHSTFVSPEFFNQMFTMHGTTMIFFVAMPVMFGFGNYLVPLMMRRAIWRFRA
jgi:cytochrome c oxidase subunit 1